MTLIEAVNRAKSTEFSWLAIDEDLDIYLYDNKPRILPNKVEWYDGTHCDLDRCTTPLAGTFKDWIIEISTLKV